MIRFILTTHTSNTDVNGNRYHFGIVTATKTGKCLTVDDLGGDSNLRGLVKSKLNLEFEEMHYENVTHAIRDFNRMQKHITGDSFYEHEVTKEILQSLES